MEDFADYLTKEAESENAAFHEFVSSYNSPDEIHVFFEGSEDFLFYLPEIRRRAGERRIFAYNCGGKWGVVGAREEIEGYYEVKTLFFVDRDFDDYLDRQPDPSDLLYVTDGYSIESEVSDETALRVLLSDLLALGATDIQAVCERVAELESGLYPRLIALSAWIIAAKDQGCNPNLNNTNSLKGVINSCDGCLSLSSAGFQAFKKKVSSGKGSPEFRRQLHWYRRVRGESRKTAVRGKYSQWIFCKAASIALHEENGVRKASGLKAMKIPDQLAYGSALELLSGRIPYPLSLRKFLDRALG